jgi:uncharacterized UPF0146 family protein
VATIDDVRRVALSLPRSYEALVREHVKFRIGRIVWASVSPDETLLGFAFPKEERAALVASDPDRFRMPLRSDERYHWVRLALAEFDPDELAEILVDAWSMCVPTKVSASYRAEHWPAPVAGSPPEVTRSWDARADRYLELFRDELAGKPYDRAALAEFAAEVGPGGRVCDAGCGPCGHVTALLAEHGLDVFGVDLSPRCVDLARSVQPGLRFEVRDQRAIPASTLDGLVSYYSLHDQPRRELAGTLAAWAAAIRSGGHLLIVAKVGTGDGVIDDPLGGDLKVYWADYGADELRDAAEAAGFHVDEIATREAYDEEIPTRRSYLRATRR